MGSLRWALTFVLDLAMEGQRVTWPASDRRLGPARLGHAHVLFTNPERLVDRQELVDGRKRAHHLGEVDEQLLVAIGEEIERLEGSSYGVPKVMRARQLRHPRAPRGNDGR